MLLTVHLDFWQLLIRLSILRGQVKKLDEELSVCSLVEPTGFSCGIQRINYGAIQLRERLKYCENKKINYLTRAVPL